MRAAVMREAAILADRVPDPGPGEVLVRTLATPDAHAKILVEPARG